mmetsp:Transcript_66989/g.160495  ORF Transcript_66989/g.160495 Transcript_66989/m.160495 type:complete len:1333 (+) Transcript_66989:102-4100(+)
MDLDRRRLSAATTVEHLVESAEQSDPARTQLVRRLSLLHGTEERQSLSVQSPSELQKALNTDVQLGLTTAEASRRLKEHGPNLIQKMVPRGFFSILLDQANVLNLLVLISAAVCLLRGTTIYGVMLGKEPDYFNGGVLLGIVLTCMFVGAYMEWSCSRIMADVSSLTTPACHVLRDGGQVDIDVADVVPGDVVILYLGDVLPADCLVLEATDLQVCEVALTGEPYDVHKTLTPEDPHSPFPSNMLYATSSIVNGSGKGIVIRTGMNTEIGKIARHLEDQEIGMTQLQITLNRVGNFVTIVVVFLVVCVFLVSFHMRINDPADQCQSSDTGCFLQKSLMRALFAACGAIPESLQPATMLLLVAGLYQMRVVKAAVRKLDAVDTLGTCSFICSDKTGTLTEGKMACVQLQPHIHNAVDGAAGAAKSGYAFYPTRGFDPRGGIFDIEVLTDEAKASINSLVDGVPGASLPPGVQDFGDPSEPGLDGRIVQTMMMSLALTSHATRLVQSEDQTFSFQGNSSEAALLAAGQKARIDQVAVGKYERITDLEVPFSSARKMMASLYKLNSSDCFEALALDAGPVAIAILKGGPDVLLPKLKATLSGRTSTPASLQILQGVFDASDKEWFETVNGDMASQGLRVLCAALRPVSAQLLQRLNQVQDANDRLKALCEDEVVLLGLVGLADPARTTAREAVSQCHSAGIRVAMITGDQRATAEAVAREIGIIREDVAAKSVSECAALTKLGSREEVDALCHNVSVWCRASPTDKVLIVESLQRQGHVVAMTGDGVNDAAALKKANIGVAMGCAGTDVAKSAADVVLLDDRFQTIVDAVAEGRRIFNNVQRMSAYLLCGNIFPVFTVMATMLLGWAVPLEEAQLFKANFVTHMFYPWCMVFEALPFYGMMQPPRSRAKPIVPTLMAKVIIPAVFLGYFISMLTAQIAGALLYVGTVDREGQMGTVYLSDFYGEGSDYVCLYANVVTATPTAEEQRSEDPTVGAIEFSYKRDVAPLHCKIKRLSIRGWKHVEEWGHEDKPQPHVGIMTADFDWFTGSWGSLFSLQNSFLASSFSNGVLTFADKHWQDHRGWLVKCSEIVASASNASVQHSSTAASTSGETIAGDSNRLCWKPCGGQLCWEADLLHGQARNASNPQQVEAREEEDEPAAKPVLYKKFNVASWGCRQMRSVVLLSMVLMELTMLFSLSKHDFALAHLFDNIAFPIAWGPMIAVTAAYMYIPVTLCDQLFAPLDTVGIAAAVIVAGCFFAFLEAAKAVHRKYFIYELAEKIAMAKLSSEGKLRAFSSRSEAWLQYPERRPRVSLAGKAGLAPVGQGYGSCSSSDLGQP